MADHSGFDAHSRSEALFARAQELLPGGVSSPVRAFRHVGGAPVFLSKGKGAHVVDEDGRSYVDYCLAWGPLILGHAHPAVVEAVTKAAVDGLAFGTCHRFEQQLGELVLQAFPYADRVRFVVSGTEAVLTAVRLARAHTGRRLLLKFSGCYHGHVDALMVKAGSGVVTQGLAESAGVTERTAQDTLVAPLHDLDALRAVFAAHGDDIAGVILEPLPANNGLLIQSTQWLQALRRLTRAHGALLIFDEVITGFRFGFCGHARQVDVEPDLTTLGKIVGGGLPVGAIVGPRAILERLAPLGPVYQAGTMAGNPVALAAGIATLTELRRGDAYRTLETLGARLQERAAQRGLRMARVGSLFWLYLDDDAAAVPVRAEDISARAVARFRAAYRGWLDRSVYLPPSAYEVGFLSAAHEPAHVDTLVDVLADVLAVTP
ncbi:MAG: aminotransferase class III-fold pyridoxal phosphate-dependent enzyme [Planctomycetes bacterium]|nr:aminotransferase class III-fold pyridoxal phosphate-dependent enzyme [Planctomycetota bacterium]